MLEARREELISAALEEMQLAHRRPTAHADPDLLEQVRRHTGEHHDLLCDVLRRGRAALPREFEFVARQAALRARRGIALHDFLEAFRIYHNVIWDAVLDAADENDAPASRRWRRRAR